MTDWLEEIEARVSALVAQTAPLLPGEGAHTEYQYLVKDVCADSARLTAEIRALRAQVEVVAAEKRHRRAASQLGIFETTDGGQTWHHLGDREESDASYKALVIARNTAVEE